MASIYDLKPAFQRLLRPTTQALAKIGVTANQVTLLACLLSLATAFFVGFWAGQATSSCYLLVVPVVMLVRMALNAIDGMLAREHGMKSRLGAILNELTDVISDSALYLAFAYVKGFRPELVVVIALLGVIAEMTGVTAQTIGASRRYDGPMGKSDRAFIFGLLGLLLALGVKPGAWIHFVLAAVALLLVLTIFNRARRSLTE